MKQFLVILMVLSSMAAAKPKFTDKQIAAMTPQYFARNHKAPKLTGLKIYKEGGARIYHVEILADRNRSSDDLSFAVSALANMGQYAKKPFKKYVVVMRYDLRGKGTDICEANARCTADYMIRKQVTYDHWYKKCITFTST
ncbi:MAG: hypothetical protein QF842_00745 [Candidatus Marinimicrobia bacterium]|jgi:hypothetical protein|nr:hypothetical protein [Candidatus Neomarinimicrobiota bacterium]|tara:strand:+ start:549 stop:971 length:423 start_codon:yes stop_codon:yes gene_type:complete